MTDWDGDDRPPPAYMRFVEVGWLVARFWHSLGHVRPRGPEGAPPALVIPGFLATDRTCTQLRRALGEAGWRVHPWNMGLNRGAQEDILHRLRQQLDAIYDGRPVLVVGWSLGGLFARELAREMPDKVRAVVTLGSPFSGHPRQNNVWRLYEMVAGHRVDDPPIRHSPEKPPVPTLALWSKRDGIVAVRAARGLDDERDKEVEMRCSHMAFGVSGRAARLAAKEIETFLKEVEA